MTPERPKKGRATIGAEAPMQIRIEIPALDRYIDHLNSSKAEQAKLDLRAVALQEVNQRDKQAIQRIKDAILNTKE